MRCTWRRCSAASFARRRAGGGRSARSPRRRRLRPGQPAAADALQPVRAEALEHAVDEAHELGVVEVDRHPVALDVDAAADDLRLAVLPLEAEEDRVVGGDRRDPALLQLDEAVGSQLDGVGHDARPGEVVDRRRALRRADPLAAQIGQAVDRRVLGHEQLLLGAVVDGAEVHRLLALAGDRERARHEVDLAVLDRRLALRGRDRREHDVLLPRAPKIARATARARSMSRPSIVAGVRGRSSRGAGCSGRRRPAACPRRGCAA